MRFRYAYVYRSIGISKSPIRVVYSNLFYDGLIGLEPQDWHILLRRLLPDWTILYLTNTIRECHA
jgi:hypothetical protein